MVQKEFYPVILGEDTDMILFHNHNKKRMKKIYLSLILLSISAPYFSQEETTDDYFEISKNLTIFSEVYKNINLYFVDETNPGELMKTGIDAMLKSLDPYTNYIPESNIEDYRMQQSGQYGGIGSLIRKSGEFVQITNPYENFPAQKAGLKAGDLILEIDGQSIKGKTSGEVSDLLKGAKETDLSIKVERLKEDKLLTFNVTREIIKIPSVPHEDVFNDGVGYLKLTQFMNTSTQELTTSFKKLKSEKKITSLILDLRGNPGGLLNEAVSIVNMFVKQGSKVVETKGRLKQHSFIYFAREKPLDLDIPIVVLIDGGSASASEIVSGTLQDLDRAVVIGNQSFGKGLVQQTRNMEYNSIVKLTIAKYYTPSGRCIQRLDYSDRNTTGKGATISDTLVKSFTTANGRPVTDGRGITPDIELDKKSYTSISYSLISKNIIFDYATDYFYSHDKITEAKDFSISDVEYNEFVKFALSKEFEYTTGSQKVLERLQELAKEEQYYESSKEEFETLINNLSPNKERDLAKFKAEIKSLIEAEIVGRYYYQKGQVSYSLANDEFIKKAVEILGDKDQYNKILKP